MGVLMLGDFGEHASYMSRSALTNEKDTSSRNLQNISTPRYTAYAIIIIVMTTYFLGQAMATVMVQVCEAFPNYFAFYGCASVNNLHYHDAR